MRFQAITAACLMVGACMMGCSHKEELVATGGSRADGTVTMSFEYGAFENPKIDPQQGAVAAAERCRAWGYTDAQPFGGQTRQCQQPSQYGCMRWFVSMTYQCLGGNRPS